jgi:hypothetical protein
LTATKCDIKESTHFLHLYTVALNQNKEYEMLNKIRLIYIWMNTKKYAAHGIAKVDIFFYSVTIKHVDDNHNPKIGSWTRYAPTPREYDEFQDSNTKAQISNPTFG